jgi:hypothetical protein
MIISREWLFGLKVAAPGAEQHEERAERRRGRWANRIGRQRSENRRERNGGGKKKS